MTVFNVKPPQGVKFMKVDQDVWKSKAPSARLDEKFSDGSVNVEVSDAEADALTDEWDAVGCVYKLV